MGRGIRIQILGAALFLLASVALAEPAAQLNASDGEPKSDFAVSHDFWANQISEPGVTGRLQAEYAGRFHLTPELRVTLDGALSPFEQIEPALLAAEVGYSISQIGVEFVFGFQQERWHSWKVTENRTEFFFALQLLSNLNVSLGAAYRAPSFNVNTLGQSFAWPAESAELSVLYRLGWKVFATGDFSLSTIFANYDRMRLYTATNVHVILQPEYRIDENWSAMGYVSVAPKGVSGAILEFSQLTLSLGLRYGL